MEVATGYPPRGGYDYDCDDDYEYEMDGLDLDSGYLRRKARVEQMMETQGKSKSI